MSNMLDVSSRLTPQLQFNAYLNTMFNPDDLVEVRGIRNRADGTSRLERRQWCLASELPEQFTSLADLNRKGINVYVGVNPRSERDGTKRSIQRCRCIWADFDNTDYATVRDRWLGVLPEPSTVVDSGHGVHAYWKLIEPISVSGRCERVRFETMLKRINNDLGADSTQDVTRLLRLPGFYNVKREPVPCRLITTDGPAVPIEAFAPWMEQADPPHIRPSQARLADVVVPIDCKQLRSVRHLVDSLDRPTRDRSRRDFLVVCKLLRLGLSTIEIKSLVEGRSKFVIPSYTRTTLHNARIAVCHESRSVRSS